MRNRRCLKLESPSISDERDDQPTGVLVLIEMARKLLFLGVLIFTSCDGTYSGEGCFIAGSPVLTPRGVTLIEGLKIGDLVYGFDVVLGQQVAAPIDSIEVRTATETMKFLGEGGVAFEVTGDHPLYNVQENRWQAAREFQIGDLLMGQGPKQKGRPVAILKMSSEAKASAIPVYNLKVRDFQNAFIGGILAHSY